MGARHAVAINSEHDSCSCAISGAKSPAACRHAISLSSMVTAATAESWKHWRRNYALTSALMSACFIRPPGQNSTRMRKCPEIHGGKNETSMMLAIAPHLVRREQIAQLKNSPGGRRRARDDPRSGRHVAMDDKREADRRPGRHRRRASSVSRIRTAPARPDRRNGRPRFQAAFGSPAPCARLEQTWRHVAGPLCGLTSTFCGLW